MELQVTIVADIDISNLRGDTGRILALASGLAKNSCNVTLISPEPSSGKHMINLDNINLHHVKIKNRDRSILNVIARRYLLIKEAKKLTDINTTLIIEFSAVGGYFACAGFKDYILDVHGIAFDEINFVKVPWYVSKKILKLYTNLLEQFAVRRAKKITVVSDSMRKFLANEWNIDKNKIHVLPNGYHNSLVNETLLQNINANDNIVTFVGVMAEWANIEKIIYSAYILKDEDILFYLVGHGSEDYIYKLKHMVKNLGLTNVIFTGRVPLNESYEMIARSKVVILPFPPSLCTEVACPIKVLEYMAFGKAIVLDDVSDIAKHLKETSSALVCDPEDEREFAENIRLLIDDPILRDQLGANARLQASQFTWEEQVNKLIKIILL